MRKILIGAVVVLVLAYPLSSWLLGFAIEKRVNEPLEQLHRVTPYAEITENTFRRGWFSSEQHLTIDLFRGLPLTAPGVTRPALLAPIQLRFVTLIHHGPICGLACVGLAHTVTHVEFSGPAQEYVSQIFGAAEPLHVEARMGFFGGGSSTFSSPSVGDALLKGGAHLNWGGVSFKSWFSREFDSYGLAGSLPLAVYTDPAGKHLEVRDLAIKANSHRALRSLYEGESSFTVGHIGFASNSAAGALSIDDLQAMTQSSSSGGFMNILTRMNAGASATGPLTLTNMHFDLSLNHLDMDSLETLSAAVRDANQDVAVAPTERPAKTLQALKGPGIALLAHQPELRIDRLSIATAQGGVQITGVVRFPDVLPEDFAAGADPKALIRKLQADFDLSLDEQFLKSLPGGGGQFAAQLQTFVDQGLLTHENGGFHSLMAFRQGVLTFNGKAFIQAPPPALASPPPPPPTSPRR